MKLIIQYYTPNNEKRNSEYLYCINENMNSKLFDEIHIFVEEGSYLNLKLNGDVIIHSDKRKNFQDLFKYCNDNFPNEICVISNTDIIFDETIKYINENNIDGKFLCLTRWEVLDDLSLEFYDDETQNRSYFSQDSWIFKSPIQISGVNFFMGVPGCDNRLAHEADKVLDVINPSKLIITKHMHRSNFRNENRGIIFNPKLGVEPIDNIYGESKKRKKTL